MLIVINMSYDLEAQPPTDRPEAAPCLPVEQARRRLDAATNLAGVLEVMAGAKAAKDRRGDLRLAALMGGLWIESMVKADTVIAEMRRRGELVAHGGNRLNQSPDSNVASCNLGDLDVSRVESCRWHQVAGIEQVVRKAYVRECLSRGRRVGVQGLLRFAQQREGRNRVRDEAWRRLQTTVTSALRGLDRTLRLAPDRALELRGCRDGLKRQLESVPLVDVIDQAARAGDDLVKPFEALVSGTLVGQRNVASVESLQVLAVLERTAVVCPAGSDGSGVERSLARLPELFVDPAVIRWKAQGEEKRYGHDGVVSPHARRRCPRCHRDEGDVQFRAYRTSYCVDCARAVAREHRRHRASERQRARAA
ncbi:MAG: hypothetical protein ACREQM_08090 [Candidatus Dormibacteraceae bacterium]